MRLFITIAQKKDGSWVTVAGPNSDYDAQSNAFKDAKRAEKSEFAEMQLWGSTLGCIKRVKFGAQTKIDPGVKFDAKPAATNPALPAPASATEPATPATPEPPAAEAPEKKTKGKSAK